ncbi:serine-rich adhesin for platelets-like [Macrobrachium nipponense]|uniref:serine-rich adhesin for platelets-like n=1 Tax=Macrobrachium nipponense TaxID=159736 RepID=UPI0030C84430
MASWTSLAVLSALVVSAVSFPDGAYNIPRVGTGRRSQYYVLHSDGTYKYGHDTGEGAFESAKLNPGGELDGEFGYRDDDGNNVNLQYKSGQGGFVARGDHLPAPHPDFEAAHAAARARRPFVDPLADTGTDASYNFQFAGEGQTRTEQSDADGNVRGSYTYTDEEGITRTVNYVAGRETGFVVEGNDLPLGPVESGLTPAATRLAGARPTSTSQFSGSRAAGASFGSRASTSSSTSANQRFSGSRTTGSSFSTSTGQVFGSGQGTAASHSATRDSRLTPQASGSHFGNRISSSRGSQSTFSAASPSRTPSTYRASIYISHSSTGSTSFTAQHSSVRRPQQAFSGSSSLSASNRRVPFEEANTRSELRPDGSYAFAYDTSSHSRSESGDSDNNVDGKFDFVADDDGQRREIQYEAGRDTGFIAEGAHIPVGPEVPGAPSGQPTGRIVPVQEVPFVDPLADTGLDASYDFAFNSEQYSRSETADADGNVRGTYTVVEDDGTRRTFNFRAGKGVGFETEQVSVSQGPPPSKPAASPVSPSSSSTFRGASTAGASSFSSSASSSGLSSSSSTSFRGTGASSSTSAFRGGSGLRTTSYGAPTSSSSAFTSSTSSRRPAFPSTSSTHSTGASAATSTLRGGSGLSATSHRAPSSSSTSFRQSSSSSVSSASRTPLRSSFTPTAVKEVFPGFQLHQYDASKNPEKFGYVLTFDN